MRKGFTVLKGGPLKKKGKVESRVDLAQLTRDEQYKIYLVEIEDYASGEGMTVDEAMEYRPFEKWLMDMGVKVEGQETGLKVGDEVRIKDVPMEKI